MSSIGESDVNKIVKCISQFLCLLRKHGILGKQEQIHYIFSGYIDSKWITNETDKRELKQCYRAICNNYKEIRLHVLMGSARIGEYVPRYLVAVEDSKRNATLGILDTFMLYDYTRNNHRLTTIMARNIHIIDQMNVNKWLYILSHFPRVEFQKYLGEYWDRDKERALEPKRTAQYLLFTSQEKEEIKANKELMELHSTFVCVSSRDADYLSTIYPDHDNSYHDYRDSDVNNFNLASGYLSDKGIVMVRMGKGAQGRIEFGNCIDYANQYYDELMDIALSRECKFYVGDSNGICIFPMTLNRPVALKNVVPAFMDTWGGHPQNAYNLFIFKKYYSKIENRFLSIKEMMEVERVVRSAHYDGKKYEELGVDVVENSAEEILDLVVEMNDRIDGIWIETIEDIELQKKYQFIFNQWCEQERFMKNAVAHAKVGALFLRKNRFLLE